MIHIKKRIKFLEANDPNDVILELLKLQISINVLEELPYFEPVLNETGPPVDENVHVEELPHLEPITNSTGPPVDQEEFHKDLPESEPFESDSGPSGK